MLVGDRRLKNFRGDMNRGLDTAGSGLTTSQWISAGIVILAILIVVGRIICKDEQSGFGCRRDSHR